MMLRGVLNSPMIMSEGITNGANDGRFGLMRLVRGWNSLLWRSRKEFQERRELLCTIDSVSIRLISFISFISLCFWSCPFNSISRFFIVKKSKAETVAQKKQHAEKEKLRQQRREEQERNVARKKASEEKGKQNKKVGEDGESEVDGEEEEEEDFDEGEWDDEEEISEGEESEEEPQSESEDEQTIERPKKRGKHKNGR